MRQQLLIINSVSLWFWNFLFVDFINENTIKLSSTTVPNNRNFCKNFVSQIYCLQLRKRELILIHKRQHTIEQNFYGNVISFNIKMFNCPSYRNICFMDLLMLKYHRDLIIEISFVLKELLRALNEQKTVCQSANGVLVTSHHHVRKANVVAGRDVTGRHPRVHCLNSQRGRVGH